MDEIKLFAKNEIELETQIQRIFSDDKEMKFGVDYVRCLKWRVRKEKQQKE